MKTRLQQIADSVTETAINAYFNNTYSTWDPLLHSVSREVYYDLQHSINSKYAMNVERLANRLAATAITKYITTIGYIYAQYQRSVAATRKRLIDLMKMTINEQ
jgi:hypothetical protein